MLSSQSYFVIDQEQDSDYICRPPPDKRQKTTTPTSSTTTTLATTPTPAITNVFEKQSTRRHPENFNKSDQHGFFIAEDLQKGGNQQQNRRFSPDLSSLSSYLSADEDDTSSWLFFPLKHHQKYDCSCQNPDLSMLSFLAEEELLEDFNSFLHEDEDYGNMMKSLVGIDKVTPPAPTDNDDTMNASEQSIAIPSVIICKDHDAYHPLPEIQKEVEIPKCDPPLPAISKEAKIEPTELDVLFGRGQGTNKHPGNERFRELVDIMRPLYFAQGKSRKKKGALSKQVMETIFGYGGRFLEASPSSPVGGPVDDMVFVEVGMKRAQKKCSQRLRETKR